MSASDGEQEFQKRMKQAHQECEQRIASYDFGKLNVLKDERTSHVVEGYLRQEKQRLYDVDASVLSHLFADPLVTYYPDDVKDTLYWLTDPDFGEIPSGETPKYFNTIVQKSMQLNRRQLQNILCMYDVAAQLGAVELLNSDTDAVIKQSFSQAERANYWTDVRHLMGTEKIKYRIMGGEPPESVSRVVRQSAALVALVDKVREDEANRIYCT